MRVYIIQHARARKAVFSFSESVSSTCTTMENEIKARTASLAEYL